MRPLPFYFLHTNKLCLVVSGNTWVVPGWVRGRKVEKMLNTVDASVMWKHPCSALQQSLILRSCRSQEASQSVTVTGATHSGLANAMLDLWEQARMGCLRTSQSLLGLLLTLWQVCQPAGASWDTSGHPQYPSMGNCFEPLTTKLSWGCFHLYSLSQLAFCQGGYMLVRAILMNLNFFLHLVFLFFQIAELASGRSISHWEDG